MADGTLMNFVTVDYMSEADMELALVRWTDNRERYLPELTSRGMLRFTVLKIWNRQGIHRLGFWYEYRDPEAYAACKDIWAEIERMGTARQPMKIVANRGVVVEDSLA